MKNQPFLHRMRFAWAGVRAAATSEMSFRVHIAATIAVAIALIVVRPAPHWWAIAALTVAVVLATELVNTAIEALADHLHPDIHPRIRVVKDCAAAAVLVVSLAALAVAAAFVADVLY